MLIAALLVVPTMILESSDPGPAAGAIAKVLNYVIWIAFAVEMIVMLAVVPSKRQWLASHPIEVIVVLLTPPFLLAAAQPIRLLRLLRLVRLLRLAPVLRKLFTAAGLQYTALLALLTAFAGGYGFHQVEKGRSLADGMYWAISTMTTVGYGDLTPETGTGRLIAVGVVGIGFVAVLTGAVAERFLHTAVVDEIDEAISPEDAEKDVLMELRDLSDRMRQIETTLHRVLTREP